jgi:hypothetical protein
MGFLIGLSSMEDATLALRQVRLGMEQRFERRNIPPKAFATKPK